MRLSFGPVMVLLVENVPNRYAEALSIAISLLYWC